MLSLKFGKSFKKQVSHFYSHVLQHISRFLLDQLVCIQCLYLIVFVASKAVDRTFPTLTKYTLHINLSQSRIFMRRHVTRHITSRFTLLTDKRLSGMSKFKLKQRHLCFTYFATWSFVTLTWLLVCIDGYTCI